LQWWSDPPDTVFQAFGVDPARGLSDEQVETHRKAFGANVLEQTRPAVAWTLIVDGIKEPMMIVLLSIAALSLAFGKRAEALVMVFVVVAYVAVEVINKFRSDRIMTRLRELTQPTTSLLRNGTPRGVPTQDVVPGDVILLSEGMRVPADIRLIESHGLFVNEAPLTGEALPVQKNARAVVGKNAGPGDRVNSALAGTTVVAGEGKGIVAAVGGATEFGTIARAAQAQRKERTLIQGAMTRLAKTLAVLAVIVSLLIPLVGFWRGLNPQEMILTWLALTFLKIPGQPPVIITMALALASFELARKQIVVKRLHGVEILGQVTAIVADKTGTLTENRMRVERFVLPDGRELKPAELRADQRDSISRCLPRYSNDPTDKPVREAVGGGPPDGDYRLLQGFSDGHSWRTLAYASKGTTRYAIAGQPEHLVGQSDVPDNRRQALLDALRRETDRGSRVVAFAARSDGSGDDVSLTGTTFLALAVLHDPVREGVGKAVAALREAGIFTFGALTARSSFVRSD
jgi:Ca2+-transporting ATPase